MAEHTETYINLKTQITNAKNGQVNIITHGQLTHEQAVAIFRATLHDMVNKEYLHDHGMTEDENEALHALIEGVEAPE